MLDDVPVLEISSNGTIRKYPSITIEADGAETKNLLSLSIKSNGTKIGRLGIKWDSSHVEVVSPDSVDSALINNPGSLVYESISPRYSIDSSYL